MTDQWGDGAHGLVDQLVQGPPIVVADPLRQGGVEALLQAVDAAEPPTRRLLASGGHDLVLAAHEQRLATWRAWEKVSRSADPKQS